MMLEEHSRWAGSIETEACNEDVISHNPQYGTCFSGRIGTNGLIGLAAFLLGSCAHGMGLKPGTEAL
jgi:hypothetical protein